MSEAASGAEGMLFAFSSPASAFMQDLEIPLCRLKWSLVTQRSMARDQCGAPAQVVPDGCGIKVLVPLGV